MVEKLSFNLIDGSEFLIGQKHTFSIFFNSRKIVISTNFKNRILQVIKDS